MKRYLGTPFHCIGGLATIPSPSAFHRIQTDGSFSQRHEPQGRIAAIIYTPDHNVGLNSMGSIRANSLTETQWASVALGLHLAVEHNYRHVGIENDNLGIIRTLIFYRDFDFKAKRNQEYVRYYFNEIMKTAAQTEWTGVRWTPRGLNRANDLFHK
jgi:hypothetical protein